MCRQQAMRKTEFSAHLLLPVPEESQITPMASLRSLVSRRQRKALRQQVIMEPVSVEAVSQSDTVQHQTRAENQRNTACKVQVRLQNTASWAKFQLPNTAKIESFPHTSCHHKLPNSKYFKKSYSLGVFQRMIT